MMCRASAKAGFSGIVPKQEARKNRASLLFLSSDLSFVAILREMNLGCSESTKRRGRPRSCGAALTKAYKGIRLTPTREHPCRSGKFYGVAGSSLSRTASAICRGV